MVTKKLAVDFYGISYSAGHHMDGVLKTWVHIRWPNTSSYIMAGLCVGAEASDVTQWPIWLFVGISAKKSDISSLSTEKRGWSSPSCWPSCSWCECCVTWWGQPWGGFAWVILACGTRGDDSGEAESLGWLWHQTVTLNKHLRTAATQEPSTREYVGRHWV